MANQPGVQTLSVEEVLRIHEILVADFAASGDPIGRMGLRSIGLLESAVNRQHSGHGSVMKYPEPLGNAATLAFGICCDHPFVNGNKRTALVALLVHMDKNLHCLHGTTQNDLYQLMLGIAGHSLGLRTDPRRRDRPPRRRGADEEVQAIKDWLARRTEPIQRGERPLRFRQLRQILGRFEIELENPHGNMIDVVRLEPQKGGFFRRQAKLVKKRLGTIGYRNEGTEVSIKDVKAVRRMCQLREEDGVDSAAFYNDEAVVDSFLNRYRTVLRRLAKT